MSKQFYFKHFSLAEVQFQCQKELYFKQFSLTYKNYSFQTSQFSISTQFKWQDSSISSNSLLHKYAV